jgi:hypothetical protein
MTIILTRYLYNKDTVIDSLRQSIDKSHYKESVFWAYELYYSGFQLEVIKLLLEIYENKFSQNHPKLGIYIRRKIDSNCPECIATVIKNLTMKSPDVAESEQTKFVNVKEHHVIDYQTKELSTICNWKFLPTVCEYRVISKKYTKLQEAKLLDIFRSSWLFHASFSPIWRDRISAYRGKIDKKNQTIIFENENDFEEFHDRYSYDSDEQSLELQKKCMGII